MLAAIRSVVEGTPLLPATELADPYQEEETEVIEAIDATFEPIGRGGAWLARQIPFGGSRGAGGEAPRSVAY